MRLPGFICFQYLPALKACCVLVLEIIPVCKFDPHKLPPSFSSKCYRILLCVVKKHDRGDTAVE
jgi:hypothetical protein